VPLNILAKSAISSNKEPQSKEHLSRLSCSGRRENGDVNSALFPAAKGKRTRATILMEKKGK